MAPPVMMIGPSAPNGPPVPMEMAEDSGFSTATRAWMRLRPMRIASMASGMPWPRIFSEPKRASRPMIKQPTTGTSTAALPRVLPAIEAVAELSVPCHARFVTRLMRRVSAQAAAAPPVPTTIAMPARASKRPSALKSRRLSAEEFDAQRSLEVILFDWGDRKG
jgi:hypothetical protein